jgi:hypothetical protein
MKKGLLIGFLFLVSWHILTMNIWRSFSDPADMKYVYYCMSSATYFFSYILIYFAVRKESKILRIISSTWLAFPAQDLFDELSGRNTEIFFTEYLAFVIACLICYLQIRGITIRMLIKYFKTFSFKKRKNLSS